MIGNKSLSLGEARSQLYSVLEETEGSVVDKYRRALSVGCAYLDVDNGHLKQIPGPDRTNARVSVASGDISWISGDTALDDAGFCSMTVERDASLAIANARAEGYEDNPGYEEHGVACYLAAPVTVGRDVYGTVCFVSPESRDSQFDPEERLFVELLAQIFGRRIETEHHAEVLADSRSKYASLINVSPDSVFLLDSTTLSVVEANDAAVALTGYDDLTDLTYPELWDGAGDADNTEMLEWFTRKEGARRTLPDGSAISLVRADGTTLPVEVSASCVTVGDRDLVHAVVRDIRDERERERRTAAIFDQTHQLTGLLSPDGTLLEANDTAVSACEENREEIIGRYFPACPWWQTDEATRDRLRDAIDRAASGEFVRYEVEIATKSGSRMIDFSIRPVTDDDGEVELLIPEGRDISDRYERDRQLDVLVRVLRHNLRNDITVIQEYTRYLAEEVDDSLAEPVRTVRETAGRIIDRMESFRRTVELLGDPPEQCSVAVTEELSTMVSTYRAAYPAAEISLSMPDDARIRAIPSVGQALDELLDNALTHARDDAPTVAVDIECAGNAVTVTVADDGPGIPDQEAQILTGEQATTPLDHGTGIGLWKAYWICQLSGAECAVDSDDGTTVTVTFPTPV